MKKTGSPSVRSRRKRPITGRKMPVDLPLLDTKENVHIRIPGEPRFLALIRTVVTMLARSADFPDSDVDKIELAVDEACSNVMEHAYRQACPKPDIELDIRWRPGCFMVDILDRGTPFDICGYVPPKFPEHWLSGRTRGAGLFLIQTCMDQTSYETVAENLNRLRLVKLLQTS